MKNATIAGTDLLSLPIASPFRMWVHNLWIENAEERLVYKENPVTIQQYWNTYKWWIKREYQHRRLHKAS
jgi:hypothetical protein